MTQNARYADHQHVLRHDDSVVGSGSEIAQREGLDPQRWRAGLVKVGNDSMVMVQRTQRRASFKSSNNCCSRSGDAMNPNRV